MIINETRIPLDGWTHDGVRVRDGAIGVKSQEWRQAVLMVKKLGNQALYIDCIIGAIS